VWHSPTVEATAVIDDQMICTDCTLYPVCPAVKLNRMVLETKKGGFDVAAKAVGEICETEVGHGPNNTYPKVKALSVSTAACVAYNVAVPNVPSFHD
jgi:hypothetical protein